MLLGSVHPAALDLEGLKRLDLIQRIYLNREKLRKLGSKIIDINAAPQLEARITAPSNVLMCFDYSCKLTFTLDENWKRQKHMIDVHRWDGKQVATAEGMETR